MSFTLFKKENPTASTIKAKRDCKKWHVNHLGFSLKVLYICKKLGLR